MAEDKNTEDFEDYEENADDSNFEELEEELSDISEDDDDEYEKVCYVCRRNENLAGKMINAAMGINICVDCLQKSFDNMKALNFTPSELSGFDMEDLTKLPNVNMINLSDIKREVPKRQRVKKKKNKKKEADFKFDVKSIPSPHIIKAGLDEYVVGQEHAKKIISVAVYNHYKRIANKTNDVDIEKSNVLMVGPTGSGKTYLVKRLAQLLDVPLAITDATSLTEAGYIGDDIESVVSKLLVAADNDVQKAECGIIFIDEIDKLAKKRNTNQRDVSGEAVQQGMLKLLEGNEVEVPVGASSKNAMVPLVTVDTKNILFICGGAFPELENIIKERLNKHSSIGFVADLKDKYDEDKNIHKNVAIEDLKNFGMIPEFIGRMPIICTLEGLTKDMLVRILKEPKNAILKQYQKLLELDEVQLNFNDEALDLIAERALKKETGARALRAIIEEFMLDIMYEIPKDDNIGRVTITKEYIEHTGGPVIDMRSGLSLEQKSIEPLEIDRTH